MKNIITALIRAQKDIQNAWMDSKNPHFNSKYASLESVLSAVKPIANDNGIAISQPMGRDEHGSFVETILFHESGETMNSKVYLIMDKNNMQGFGSASSYARRFALAAIFAIGQDDDDGNVASQPAKPPPKPSGQPGPIKTTEERQEMYIVPGGTFRGKMLIDIDPTELATEVAKIELEAKKTGKPLAPAALNFVARAHKHLEAYK